MPTEEWRSIVGYENIYEVSNLGRVRRCDHHYKSHCRGHFLRPSTTPNGYHRVTLYNNHKKCYRSVYALVIEAFLGPRPDGFHVDHKDGNKTNDSDTNLEYVSPQENIRRSIIRNLRVHGKRRVDASLNEIDVRRIRELSRQGLSRVQVSRMFSVSAPHISQIVHCRKWKTSYE